MNSRSPHARRGREGGQALIELLAVVVIFSFLGIATLEAAVLYRNLNVVSNGLKEATWAAAYGAHDREINRILDDMALNLLGGAFLAYTAESFVIEVHQPAGDTVRSENYIAPFDDLTRDEVFSGGKRNQRAAYLYRAEGMSVRLGLLFEIGYFVPFFGTNQMISVRLPLAVAQPVAVRNDEDRDGLVDLYEPELFVAALGLPWSPLSHIDFNDSEAADPQDTAGENPVSDTPARVWSNIDGDTLYDINDPPGAQGALVIFAFNYDWNNDGIEDRYEAPAANAADTRTMINHPVIGGPGQKVVIPAP